MALDGRQAELDRQAREFVGPEVILWFSPEVAKKLTVGDVSTNLSAFVEELK